MPKFEVKMEAVVTYEVTVDAESGDKAERAAEYMTVELPEAMKAHIRNLHTETSRALWVRDVTPLEDQIEGWIEQLQARGYRVKPPAADKGNDSAAGGYADASADQAGDGAVREDEAGSV